MREISELANLITECEKMKLKLCLGIASFGSELKNNNMSLRDVIDLAHRCRFNRVELCDRVIPEDFSERLVIKNIIEQKFIQLSAIDIRNDFTHRDPRLLEENICHVKRWIEFCSELSVPIARIWLGTSIDDDRAYWQSVHSLERITKFAENSNVRLALENHGGISSKESNLTYIVNLIDSPYFGLCVDFGWLDDHNRINALQKLIPSAIHIHAKAHAFETNGNEVNIDYKAIGSIIRDVNYNGIISIEYEGDGKGEERVRGILQTVELIHRYF